eukprot:CAMPEP_0175947388 /NCGR_PEP_ID=MMETSP0108-20121206/27851_1 /TAXON_ID=195067 ORGANISM="Goniomonas pacifica, Strain CCMP1869" /NCGR_SAMPLE_ID=MMETSP0108 /ASSEMBLY_ACC=CAM_ASM_000204 /LENGTH=95 /DNA_ID=CAMNT_0017272999 /DNA_START=342 /DNA_END=629 /DNA_ORIENTATION=+
MTLPMPDWPISSSSTNALLLTPRRTRSIGNAGIVIANMHARIALRRIVKVNPASRRDLLASKGRPSASYTAKMQLDPANSTSNSCNNVSSTCTRK